MKLIQDLLSTHQSRLEEAASAKSRYSAADFDGDNHQVAMHIAAARKILASKNVQEYLAATETNFDVDGLKDDAAEMIADLTELSKKLQKFYHKIIKAS